MILLYYILETAKRKHREPISGFKRSGIGASDSDCKGEVRDEVVEVHPKYGSCYMDLKVCQNSWIGKPKTSHLY